MKVLESKTLIETSGMDDGTQFTINDKNIAHVMNVLRNNLYSNKVLAVIREYSTNASDAHVEVGQPNLPIEVTMPTRLSSNFKIRDFGPGMSDDKVRNIYTSYGESTKRDTDEQTGMLGFGSKSAFAYANAFAVTSFYNGKKIMYQAYIDDTNIGKISQITSADTDQPNGIEISIAVKPEDISTFVNTAIEFYRFFSPRPIIYGSSEVVEGLKKYDTYEWLLIGNGWKLGEVNRSYSYRSIMNGVFVVMGNITYPLNAAIWRTQGSDFSKMIETCNLVIEAPIGSVMNAANREALEYNKPTRDYLEAKFKEIAAESTKQFVDKVVNAKTLFEAREAFGELGKAPSYLRGMLPHSINYNGVQVDSASIPKKEYEGLLVNGTELFSVTNTSRGGISYVQSIDHIPAAVSKPIVIDDMTVKRGSVPYKLRDALSKNKDGGAWSPSVTLFRVADSSEIAKIKAHPSFIGATFANLSDYDGTKPKSTGGKRDQTQAKCKIFEMVAQRFKVAPSNSWKVTDLDLKKDKGVYVRIDGFKPFVDDMGCNDNMGTSNELLVNFLEEITKVMPNLAVPTVYGIRNSVDFTNINSGWITLKAWLIQAIEDYFKKNNLNDVYSDYLELQNIGRLPYHALTEIHSKLNKGTMKTLLENLHNVEIANKQHKINEIQDRLIHRMSVKPKINGKSSFDVTKLTKESETKYPLLGYIIKRSYNSDLQTPQYMKEFTEYINAFDTV